MRLWVVVSNADGAVLGAAPTYSEAAAIGVAAWDAELCPQGWTALPYDDGVLADYPPAILDGKLDAANTYAAEHTGE